MDTCSRIGENPFCGKCPTQCYRPEIRRQVRAVMRYAGPRMLWHRTALKYAPEPQQ